MEKTKVNCCHLHDGAPIPQNGKWNCPIDITDISGFSHGVGGCAPQQGACKLTINVEKGFITEALVETIGCTGMTHSACMASEILVGKSILEALNTDLVCDAINVAMKNVFNQLIYGRSQSAFTDGGLEIGAGKEELGKYVESTIGTSYSNSEDGVRYYNTSEGYIYRLGLDKNDEIIGYQFIKMPQLLKDIENGQQASVALSNNIKNYGRFEKATKIIDPRAD